MNWEHDKDKIEIRADGTFVVLAEIDGEMLPYHITPDYSPELYAEVEVFLCAGNNRDTKNDS